MHIRCIFDGGKVINRCNRGSWHARCFGAAVRKNVGPQWSPQLWHKCTDTPPGFHFQKVFRKKELALESTKRCQCKPEMKNKRWKRKMISAEDSNSKRARMEYGPEALVVEKDIETDALEVHKTGFFNNHVNVSQQKITSIEATTQHRSHSDLWKSERRKRLTASNFGRIFKRNPNIPVKAIVKDLLYSSFKGNQFTTCGLNEERDTIKEYVLRKADEGIVVNVDKTGLVIHKQHCFLAATPDGKVVEKDGEVGLIEIKNFLYNKPINLSQVAKCVNGFCLEFREGKLHLKENHNYFYQCQGQMNVTGLPWIDFEVRTQNPYQLHIERIYRNNVLWEQAMLPKLKAFYFKCVLPELAVPREGKHPGIREPGVWYSNVPTVGSSLCKSSRTRRKKCKKKHVAHLDSSLCSDYSPTSADLEIQCSLQDRSSRQKFVGRQISHQWIVDEDTQETQWYLGTVLGLIRGTDGDPSAVYEILYEGFDEPYEIDNLVKDYKEGEVRFVDV